MNKNIADRAQWRPSDERRLICREGSHEHCIYRGSRPYSGWPQREAPLPATERALKKAGMKIDDIDLFEVNEAFAPVPVAWLQATGADPARLNVTAARLRSAIRSAAPAPD